MVIGRDVDMNKALWFLGGALVGYLVKEAVEDYLMEQEIAAADICGGDAGEEKKS